jgi:hypothetical protein
MHPASQSTGRGLSAGRTVSRPLGQVAEALRAPCLPAPAAWSAFAGLLLLAASRSPYLLLNGRFWAEEGAVHFQRAVVESDLDALLYTYAGYFNLPANVSTWLASLVALRFAPLVPVWLSFGVLAAIVWVALRWPSRLLPNGASRLAAAGLLIVGTVAFPEVWLNSLNAQTYLGLLTLLIAFVPASEMTRRQFGTGVVMLGIAGLSGLYSVALVPLFLLEAWYARSRRSAVFAATITGAGLVQLAVVLSDRANEASGSTRLSVPTFEQLSRSLAGRQLSALVLGHDLAGKLLQGQVPSPRSLVMATLALVIGALLVALCLRVPDRRVPLKLGVAFVWVQILIQIGAIGRLVGGRYVVVPLGILTLLVVHAFASAGRGWVRWSAAVLCGAILIAGLSEFWTYGEPMLRCTGCPRWSAEVERYRAGHTTELEIWPYHEEREWKIYLPLESASRR